MSDLDVYAICEEEDIEEGQVMPFSLAKAGANGVEAFPIVIARDGDGNCFAFVNVCPHGREPLYSAPARLKQAEGHFLVCSRHGAAFELETGLCLEGPCQGAYLEAIPAMVLDGDVCIAGVALVEDDEGGPPEVMITAD